jgi:glutamyl-tRNA synthetase
VTVRCRFAPAPSGSLHVGNVRSALFSWLWARRNDGNFILRVEDTDASRVTEEAFRGVLEDLRWLGIDWDEGPEVGGGHGPYRQSGRLGIYQEMVDRLVEQGAAYRCYCTDGARASTPPASAASRPGTTAIVATCRHRRSPRTSPRDGPRSCGSACPTTSGSSRTS